MKMIRVIKASILASEIERLKAIIKDIGIKKLKEDYWDEYDYLSNFIRQNTKGLSDEEVKMIEDELWSDIISRYH